MLNKKGIVQVLEQTFVVIFGLVILLMVVVVFSDIGKTVSDYVAEVHFKNIGIYVHNAMVQSYVNGRFANNYTVYIDIPPQISGHSYSVIIENNKINVKDVLSNINSSVDIYKLSAAYSGNMSSTSGGKHKVFYDSNNNAITLSDEVIR